ncbi:YggS family pyridoxal phosphate-dependent enzyme [Aerococcaceae bacterium DSM 111020]|nr:YggS family pyridoxal phosphate-dependent enzyme [Aerococcaceae bacterium DSM 111020]
MSIKQNVQQINKNIQEINANAQLVAVTKYVGEEEMRELLEAGMCHFGENRVAALREKQSLLEDVSDSIQWHFIGNLQTRAVKDVINQIDYLHSLDRLKLAKEIQKRANHTIQCFLQVNVSGEESKSGIHPAQIDEIIEQMAAFDKIHINGLMTMAPIDATDSELQEYFAELKSLQENIAAKKIPHAPCTELSMGMSRDYLIALEEGATYVRIGSALYQ